MIWKYKNYRGVKIFYSFEEMKTFIRLLEKNRIKYRIHAGYGLEGLRGKISREHWDLDLLSLKKYEKKLEKIIEEEGYEIHKHRNLLKIMRNRIKIIDIGLLVKEGDKYVSYGAIAETRFPSKLFKPQKGHIGNFKFNIASNELLKLWGSTSKYINDRKLIKNLEVDTKLYKKIRRKLYA